MVVDSTAVEGSIVGMGMDMLEDKDVGMAVGSTVLVGKAVDSKGHSNLMNSLSAQLL